MSPSRRAILAGAGASLVPTLAQSDEVARLAARCAEAHGALMRGDVDTYRALIRYTDDLTLMTPFGGAPTRASDLTDERVQAMAHFFRNGTFEQQVVQAYGATDLVALVVVERQHVEVGGLPAQDWPLRVTLIFRRVGSDWRLAHRHADPLVAGISVERAAALARGE
ncbi:YybH family protein [Methylobacterium oxalidis]|uniref:SnoaL-like domain-containing protein n=1 Tax=Methylobacterium oxalidis TaxID=944322 RepID=A0A512J978_9HYPH|nr:nuclear transport factor 2 family protein [Methylobacterium oxalidis]GEP06508.1 hypothetical protein MOX02_45460 [Methylobacterium oxalidis]GJE30706.1 hypothetical protein LDDCCGHA_0875 [Methylobacterium oxalidis]GLS63914.1 hypothetical protein GCM10007888_22950 [Methylobacterium oxalidis]